MDLSPLFITLKVAITATLITIFLGIPAAFGVAKMKRGKGIVDGLFTLPMVLPPTVVGFFLLLLIGKNSPIGQFLLHYHIAITFTWIAAVFASTVVAFPLMYRTARGAFESIDPHLVYAGQTLGMSNFQIFIRVILPNAFPGMLAGIVLSFARALGEFGATIMVAGNIPGRTQTMAIAIYAAVQRGDRASAYQWVIIILLMSFGTMFLMNNLATKQKNNQTR